MVNATKPDNVLDRLKGNGLNIVGYAPGFLRHVGEDGAKKSEAAAQSGMSRLFFIVDVITVVLAVVLEALVVVRWMKKRKASPVVRIDEKKQNR